MTLTSIKKLNIRLEMLHFQLFPRYVTNAQTRFGDRHEKWRDGHGKIFGEIRGSPSVIFFDYWHTYSSF